jgi:hypothetical protein
MPSAEYVSVSATRRLLRDGLTTRSSRLAADDMLSTNEAAALTGSSQALINTWIANGRCIGLSQPSGPYRLPRWQFEPGFLPVVCKLAKALGTTEGWALLAFLESPHGALDGATPRSAIERGQEERVLAIAGWEA